MAAPFPNHLAVYGTLQTNHSAHHLLDDFQFVARTYTRDAAFKLKGGIFPTLLTGGDKQVLCEIYEFKDLEQLTPIDDYEGYPHFYNRALIYFANFPYPCWTYTGLSVEKEYNPLAELYISEVNGVERWQKSL